MRAHDVAIEQRGLTSMLQEFHCKHFGRDRLPGAAQPRKPNTHTLTIFRRISFGENLPDFRPRKPLRQLTSLAKIILASLSAGYRQHSVLRSDIGDLFVSPFIR